MELKIRILQKVIERIKQDFYNDELVAMSEKILKREIIDETTLKKILYVIISFYLIDEIAPQPVKRINFLDPGSYYFRSEISSIDFPNDIMHKYNIKDSHLDREFALFFSNKNFIKNYLKKEIVEEMGDAALILAKEVELIIPTSRQLFLIEYFLTYPEQFWSFFSQKYNSNYKDAKIISLRRALGYDKFLIEKIKNNQNDSKIKDNLSSIVNNKDFLLTSSGTAANQLAIKYVSNNNTMDFYHKYWYFENTGNNQTKYFKEIAELETMYDNFFVSLNPTNFVDIEQASEPEEINLKLRSLVKKLSTSNKKYNIVLDITSDPFYEISNIPSNINLIKTISLSKFQEGLNTNFIGIVIADNLSVSEMKMMSEYYGFNINKLEEEFIYIPDISRYKERISTIKAFNSIKLPSYKKWTICSVGLSVTLVPDQDTMVEHLKKFSNQTNLKDREFTWILRQNINNIIHELGIEDMLFGDSFLFPDSRVTVQGQSICSDKYGPNNFKFKYRLPRISAGYNISLNEISKYYEFYKQIIDLYTIKYSEL